MKGNGYAMRKGYVQYAQIRNDTQMKKQQSWPVHRANQKCRESGIGVFTHH